MTTMKISTLLTDDAVLIEFGKRLAARRIDMQLTQAALADQAGIAKRTLERMEAGQTSQLDNVIRVLRVLEVLPALETLLPEPGPRPMDLLQRGEKTRKRASGKRKKQSPDEPWQWGETP